MAITPYAAGTYANDINTRRLVALKGQLNDLSGQLATGRVSETYGGLGSGRGTSLNAHAQLSALDGYDAAIDLGRIRIDLASAGVGQAATLASDTWNQLSNTVAQVGGSARLSLKSIAEGRLGGFVDALNQSSAGQYLFGGRVTDIAPVETADKILNGDPAAALDGIGAVIAERQAADLGTGTPRTGRLSLTQAGAALTLSESADPSVRANFGFTIEGAVSSNPSALGLASVVGSAATASLAFASQPRDGDIVRVTVQNADGSQSFVGLMARISPAPESRNTFAIGADAAQSAANLAASLSGRTVVGAQSAAPPGVAATLSGGTAAAASISVAAQPSPGDTLRITLGLRDGTSTTITLIAAADGDTAAGRFAIGATPEETASHLSAALSAALEDAAANELTASSATRAASDFFAGSASPGLAPRRVALDAAGAATGYVADPSDRTVIWYRGDDASADPRQTLSLKVSSGESVAVGLQANEPALRNALAGIAVAASVGFTDDKADDARFAAFADRLKSFLQPDAGQTIEQINTDLSLASSRIQTQKSQNSATRLVLQNSLDGIESVSNEEVAAKLLTIQTQLQASYQTTATLAKLSLANYL
ncbi:hypothetical protein [Methylobacterium nodulans]|uniref:Flagellin C-terminal domain-containing protein n=1 Tax=Methylobacterium nodulans (strain LMG 21967 / CNCM I-2342 / ORS 2060) TaxID=460265 RepID=B8IB73_METNO|nr:hypothetical protein [Methylobacterium nodulans]ACL57288.1 conserved hypothetical protein [Methylobacterium nodulans ORS 2060]